MISHYLSFDLGASSGRAFVSSVEKGLISLDEIYRFSNETLIENNLLFWDFQKILINIKKSIKIAFKKYPNIKSIGIDTWGVDYGLIGENGKLIRNPVCYRDLRTIEIIEDFQKIISRDVLYESTGIQYMPFNTIYQLFHDFNKSKEQFDYSETLLLMPDLIAYYLTGEKRIEVTNLSTTNLYDPNKKQIIPYLEDLGIPNSIFPKFINPGEIYGNLKVDLANELNIPSVPVIAVCSHDTASAIASIASKEPNIYISSGTWSLCGTLLDKPNTSVAAMSENYTNEIGYDNKVRFLKNIMGLWIVNKCREEWKEGGIEYSNIEIEEMILSSEPFVSYIDPDEPSFIEGKNITEKIKKYCKDTLQVVPSSHGDILRCIYQSLAFKYRYVIEKLEEIVNYKFSNIVIVGGGGQIDLLNQMVASFCNKTVEVGPKEATILGNALILMLQDKMIKNMNEGRKIVSKYIGKKLFKPLLSDEYNINYKKYYGLMERGK